MTQLYGYVNDATLQGAGEGTAVGLQASKRGELRVIDFETQMLLQGRIYQIVAGTVATGVAMDSVITDTDAEMCIDAAAGAVIIPVRFGISFDDIATATTVKVRVKAVGTASNAGTAFTSIPLLQGGVAGLATARVQETGAVQVVGEVATQSTPLTATRVLFAHANVNTETPASVTAPAALAGPLAAIAANAAELRYVGKGVACVYVQAAATTAFPLYFAQLDFIDIPTVNL